MDGKVDVLYARYSSHAQDDRTSIEVQIEACERAAGKALRRYIDLAKTGRAIGGRDELQRLIRDAESGLIGKLYVYKFDRLGRAAHTHVLIEDLEDCGVEVVSVTEGANALARGVQLVVAADYSRALAERTRAGLLLRHRQGCWTGGPPPYGYRIVEREDKRKRLAVNPQEADEVRWMFERFLAGAAVRQLARELEARLVPTRRGGPWCFGSVRAILTNRVVVGEVVYLRREFRLNRASGKRRPRMTGRDVVRPDPALAIVSPADFDRVAEMLKAQAVRRPMGPRSVRPFTRLVHCGECGASCYADRSRNSKGDYWYYRCSRRRSTSPCANAANVREDTLLHRVRLAMDEVLGDADAVLDEAIQIAEASGRESARELERARAELKAAEVEAERAGVALTKALVDPDVDAAAKRLLARMASEAETRAKAKADAMVALASRVSRDSTELVEECRKALTRAREQWHDAIDAAAVNQFIGEVVGSFALLPSGEVRTASAEKNPGEFSPGSANSGGRI